ncbi:Uncharacterised protein [Mycobacteroides abscessus subsp. abscessus]|nr:Uncharacterised protein [Mycobacteroides abscessus subsp. abscessus]
MSIASFPQKSVTSRYSRSQQLGDWGNSMSSQAGRDSAGAGISSHPVSLARILKVLAVLTLVVFLFLPAQTQHEIVEQIIVLFEHLWALVDRLAAGLTEMR